MGGLLAALASALALPPAHTAIPRPGSALAIGYFAAGVSFSLALRRSSSTSSCSL